LPGGAYRALLAADDGHGKTVTHQVPLLVRDPNASAAAIRLPMDVSAPTWTVEPGHDLLVLWGTGYPTGRALVQIEHGQKILQRFWTPEGRTQVPIRFPVTESLRGGFTLHVTFVRENRCYRVSHEVSVPWTNQKLELAWSTFRAKLEPGQKETWSVAVKPPPGGPPLSAEMVATLFDASLDQFFPLNWPDGFHVFGSHYSSISLNFANEQRWLDRVHGRVRTPRNEVRLTYRSFPPEFLPRRSSMMVRTMATAMAPMAAVPLPEAVADALEFRVAKGASPGALEGAGGGALAERAGAAADRSPAGGSQAPASPGASVRRNLQETAFFLPHLLTDRDGGIRLEFTLPEALTRWRFLGFAHDARLRAGLLEGAAVASRDLMILPNPPRFLREGDEVEFSARIINQSEVPQRGTARLDLKYATGSQSGTEANAALGLSEGPLAFEIPAGATRGVSWRLRVPDGAGFLTYEVSARGLRHTDGESGILPVLSRRVLVTESLPLPIRGPGRKTFTFEALRNAAQSASLTHERFTVQMASNPAWYAVLALPTLMEYPHECAEQVFNRLYANALAHALATRDPRLRQTFELWRNTPALDSPLEKNGDLKSVALAETPWVRDAKSESEARRNLGLLFDPVRNKAQTDRALRQLAEMSRPEGGWSWFPGGPWDEFITLYIVAGFGRLQQLGVELPDDLPARALPVLDQSMHERWDRLRTDKVLEGNHLTPSIAFYLYARSFFARRHPLAPQHFDSFAYWLAQAETHWVKLEHRLPQGHLALAFHRLRTDTPLAARTQLPEQILRSLAERSVTHEELGRFWREDEYSASWFRAPIETQALMIEAFSLLAPDRQVVDELKIWLLKQKQTQDWKTTKATADAVYALLLHGSDLLADARLVKVSVGGRSITPGMTDAPRATGPAPTSEPGTGFFETRYARAEITPALARIEVDKPTPGIAWGAAHWQYFEDITRLRAHAATPLRLEKSVLKRVPTATGPELRPLGDRVQVGDELVVRLTLRTDRDLEYVHLKDQRGSGTEPVNVLSGYRFQDGFGYYESTKDTASHFFLGYLPKGTYVFEYAARAQLRGRYTAGMAEVQCLYAPEFNSHSTSIPLNVE
ncbi:MAG: hypothetical protein IT580_15285, partial [Verrucomicrobiales bacterium]|nr:hypothetical protein [Verrucomicrobiales bacterium]